MPLVDPHGAPGRATDARRRQSHYGDLLRRREGRRALQRAASGIRHFDELLDEAARRSPQRRTVEGCEVGRVALLLASPYASAITGEVVHVDAGFHVEGMVFH